MHTDQKTPLYHPESPHDAPLQSPFQGKPFFQLVTSQLVFPVSEFELNGTFMRMLWVGWDRGKMWLCWNNILKFQFRVFNCIYKIYFSRSLNIL
jgi:hypothetical protein